jgi:TPR repeat protein
MNYLELTPLAESGDRTAQTTMGLIHYHGVGVKKNYMTAKAWFTSAAAQGDKEAMHFLQVLNDPLVGGPFVLCRDGLSSADTAPQE